MTNEDNKPANQDFLSGSVTKTLFQLSTPIGLGMLSTFLFQLVDTYFVGKLGSQELAALSFCSPVYSILLALVIGFAVGVATVVAQAIGKQQFAEARRLATLSLVLVGLASVALSVLGFVLVHRRFACWVVLPMLLSWPENTCHLYIWVCRC